MNTDGFVNGVVGVVISVIVVVAVAIPIISSNQVASTVTNYSVMNTLINILPIFLLIAIVVGCLVIMKNKKQ